MAGQEDTRGIVVDAESLIDAKEYPTALWRLRLAAGQVRADDANAAWLFERIRDAAQAVAWADPRYERDAQAVWDIVVKREAEMGLTPENPRPSMPRRSPSTPRSWGDEAWYFAAAEVVAALAIVASALSVIVGLVVAFKASQYTESGYDTHHNVGVFFLNLAGALFVALLWIGVAAALKLLVHIARGQRAAAARA
jgi:hypothetical protein